MGLPPVSTFLPDGVLRLSLLRRDRRAFSRLRAAPRETPRFRLSPRPPDPDRADRQLRVLQLARNRALRAPDRRRGLSGARGPARARAGSGAEEAVAGRGDRPGGHGAVSRERRPAGADDPAFGRRVSARRAPGARVALTPAQREPVRPLRRDDDAPSRDHRRGERGRPDVAALRVTLEARSRPAAAPLRRPGSTDAERAE